MLSETTKLNVCTSKFKKRTLETIRIPANKLRKHSDPQSRRLSIQQNEGAIRNVKTKNMKICADIDTQNVSIE